MDSERWQRVKDLFQKAVELSGNERRAFLDRDCTDDKELLAEVLSLLESDHGDTEFLEVPAGRDIEATEVAPEPRRQGDTVGPYRILRKIGEGGMGEVYEAEQRQPVRRRVALKVIKRGMDTREVIARFELERQALALMSHRSIARVFDAGSTPAGRPYFAMEYVKGIPITEYCDRHRLPTEERLELFLEVCSAVQHAHQKGIIHRDLKPSNLLVEVEGEEAVPKVIDFGVAKATAQRLTEKTLFTQLGQWVGTPEYMSPEQADLTGLDVDTRTDVYALGVVLYELLAGAKPFDSETLRRAGFDEVRRVIREEDPPKPSTRVSSLGEASTTAARNRRVNATALRRHLQGDLDAITMKALEKDRTRRYGSPMELAADVERYLKDEPVLASPPSALYRAGKFARRHRAGVGVATLLALVLVAFGIAMSIQSARVARERDRAEIEAARALAFNEFVQETILSPDPVEGLGREVTVAEALGAATHRIEELSGGQPEVEASLRRAIGWAFLKLGRYDKAEPLLLEALKISERVLGPEHLETAESQLRVGELLEKRGDGEAAEARYRRALKVLRSALGNQDPRVAVPLKNLGALLDTLGRYDEAEALLQEALAIYEAQGRDTVHVAELRNALGVVAWNQEDYDAAESFFRDVLRVRRAIHGEEHAQVAESLNNLAVLLNSKGAPKEAEQIFREVLRVTRKVFGEKHDEVATSMSNLAMLVDARGGYEEAERLYRSALAIDRKQLGEDHSNVAVNMLNLGAFLVERGRAQEASSLLEESVKLLQKALDPGHWRIGGAHQWYGHCLGQLGRFAEAERQLLEGIGILEAASGSDSQRTIRARSRLADVYEAWGKPEKAAQYQ